MTLTLVPIEFDKSDKDLLPLLVGGRMSAGVEALTHAYPGAGALLVWGPSCWLWRSFEFIEAISHNNWVQLNR